MNGFQYVITYYETGFTPMKKTFTSYATANEEWKKMVNDPMSGAYSFESVELIDGKAFSD